jgi:hypothetical protein
MVEQPERYCTNCGHQLKLEDQFCTDCGMPVHRGARVPTPKADRPASPLPPPTQEVGRRSSPGSGALRGCGTKLVVLLVLGVLFLYLVLPLVLESLIASRLQTELDIPTKPAVEVRSNFPPMMLLGRIDSVRVTGLPYSNNARAYVKDVSLSVPSLIYGDPSIKAESCSPSIDQNVDQIQCKRVGE